MRKLINALFNFSSIIPPRSNHINHQTIFLNNVFFFAGVVALGMGFIRWQNNPVVGAIDFGFSILCFGLLAVLNRSKAKVEFLSTVALILCAILFFAIYFLADYNATRSSLLFLLMASVFFLKGKSTGLIWLAGILSLILINHATSIFDTRYTNLDILTLCLYLIAQFFIINNYESIKESQYQQLQQLNANLEEIVNARTTELAIANTKLEQEKLRLKELSDMDRLTGLDNRYKFEERFIVEQSLHVHLNEKASIIIIDIDHFKSINDTYGHLIGDNVLKEVAHVIKHNIRSNDAAVRWGGDEFIIFTPRTELKHAAHLAEKIRHQINQIDIPAIGRITTSLGLTELKPEDTLQTFINRADRALYIAKEAGRNNVQMMSED